MRVLVTNDDGVEAAGLHALARHVLAAGHDVVVAAPSSDRSGSGAAIGVLHADQHLDVSEVELPGLPAVPAFAVDGPPGLCVVAARLGAFGDAPEAVASGINPGCNTGRSILHSGTVGAVLTAANFGVSGVAVSLDAHGTPEDHEQQPPQWDTAGALAGAALGWVEQASPGTAVNLNVPDVALGSVRGVRWAELAPFGTVRAAVVEAGDGRLQVEMHATSAEVPPDSDTTLVGQGFAAVTVITGVRPTGAVPIAETLQARLENA